MKKLLSYILPIIASIGQVNAQSDLPTRQQITEDLYVKGSLGIGESIENNQSFGFDTFILREDNLRVLFDDNSSSASFPANDWRFTFNDSNNGGNNYFSIDDVTGGKTPFRIDAGSPNNSLYVASNGFVGIGTNTPDIHLNITNGNTPTVRLEQNGSGGYSAQSWDVAGNEVNFFIRDVTNGSKLPFKIKPNTPSNTLALSTNRNVGIGFSGNNFPNINSNASLELKSNTQGFLINRVTTEQRATLTAKIGDSENGLMVYDTTENTLFIWNGTQWQSDQDHQDITLLENTLSLSNDNSTVDLAKYLDNTDAQDLNLTDNELTLTNDTTPIDLSKYLDNKDEQDLDLVDNTLSLSNDSSTVDLTKYLDNTDAQKLTTAMLNNNVLTIGIENGNQINIDLSSILVPLQNENTNQQSQINDLIARMEALETCTGCQVLNYDNTSTYEKKSQGILYQNIPNPFSQTSSIKYFVPNTTHKAVIIFSTNNGKVVAKVPLTKFGENSLDINSTGLAKGTYLYTLVIDGQNIDTKKMIID